MILRETFPVGDFQCNCSIVADLDTKDAIVVDPGGGAEKLTRIIREHDLTIRSIVHTHAHVDHILATRDVKEAHGGSILLHGDDLPLYEGLAMQAAMFGMRARTVLPVDHFIGDGEEISFGKINALVIHTPGHTPGSVCFAISQEGENLLFSGDTLFCRGIGRTDLWGGDYGKLERSIRERIYSRTASTLVIPGHGPETTILDEARENPFVRAG